MRDDFWHCFREAPIENEYTIKDSTAFQLECGAVFLGFNEATRVC